MRIPNPKMMRFYLLLLVVLLEAWKASKTQASWWD
jgi:hypothetical protein